MTLTTHAITGAALATLMPTYLILGFAVGFASHFLLDAIPHWDYSIASMESDERNPMNNDMATKNKDFPKDLLKIGIDGILGLLLSFILLGMFHQHSPIVIFLGAVGGMAPDALQFFYWKWRHEPLVSLQRFHIWIHAKTNLKNKPVIGILFQVALICFIVFIFR